MLSAYIFEDQIHYRFSGEIDSSCYINYCNKTFDFKRKKKSENVCGEKNELRINEKVMTVPCCADEIGTWPVSNY